ncbi:MAG TPA: helix-turn-helix transcriptional regulator [Bradyrhizobium sp.]|nr:helix-turn-helix transcriptional regulator [Bradyrhizobium sp.]
MADEIRMSGPTLKVCKVFVEDPKQERSGAELSKLASIGSGTLYPLLQRLENAGWLASKWEEVDPAEAGRPRRRFYKLTAPGQKKAQRALADLQTSAPGVVAWNS